MKIRSVKKCETCKKIKRIEEFATRVFDKNSHKEFLNISRGDDLRDSCQACRKRALMFQAAKFRAKTNVMEFNLELKDIVIPNYCPVLGIEIGMHNEITSSNSPTLDRIDNNKGYVKGNVIVVSHKANAIKNDASIEELEKVYLFYKNLLTKEKKTI